MFSLRLCVALCFFERHIKINNQRPKYQSQGRQDAATSMTHLISQVEELQEGTGQGQGQGGQQDSGEESKVSK